MPVNVVGRPTRRRTVSRLHRSVVDDRLPLTDDATPWHEPTRDDMHPTAIHRRLPRAGHDPIDEPATALATISSVMRRPLRPETILLLLDGDR